MVQQVVKVGAETIIVNGATLADVLVQAQYLKEIAARVKPDSVFRYRKNDGGEFVEIYSPSLKAIKKLSQYKPQQKPHADVDYYMGMNTPWQRYIKEQEGIFDIMFDWVTDEIKESGFPVANTWYRAEWTEKKVGKIKQYVWQPVD